MATQAMQDKLRAEARRRVEQVLNGLNKALGPLDREELGAMLDGAQEAVMEWEAVETLDRREAGR